MYPPQRHLLKYSMRPVGGGWVLTATVMSRRLAGPGGRPRPSGTGTTGVAGQPVTAGCMDLATLSPPDAPRTTET
eukprot:749268-Hanusia_phi.AAC.1